MINDRLKGTGVALITPFAEDFSVDFDSLGRVLGHVTEGNADYLVVMGTTGESPTLTWSEKEQVLEYIIDHNKGTLPIVFGLGGFNTLDILEKLKLLKKYPIDAILSVSPFYNKPSQKGLIQHYQQIADHSPFPVLLYNVPARTQSNILAETTVTLSYHPNIIGTKEASGDLIQCARIMRETDESFLMISGDDALTVPLLSLGAHGVISVAANLVPALFCQMVNKGLEGDFAAAARLHMELLKTFELLGKEGNPVSLKAGMSVAGLIRNVVRLPLAPSSETLLEAFREELQVVHR